MRIAMGMLLIVASIASSLQAEEPQDPLDLAARRAVTGCSRGAGTYYRQLRAAGPSGLAALRKLEGAKDIAPFRWQAAMDAVGGARYSCRSGLYWHTDLEKALAESKKVGKPVLSLRMLGKLTDEYSCANSRFFRTTLYSSPEIAKLMGERFVLHWKTVRPVPVMTIDFGDGRILKRTITGNSAHYLLDGNGRPLDVLPGLHAPVAFQRWLSNGDDLYRRMGAASQPAQILASYHRQSLSRIERSLTLFRRPASISANDPAEHYWTTDISVFDRPPASRLPAPARKSGTSGKRKVSAAAATVVAQPKSAIQSPLVASVLNQRKLRTIPGNPPVTIPLPKVVKKTPPNAARATRIAAPKKLVENALVRAILPGSFPRAVVELRSAEIPAIAAAHPELSKLDDVTAEIMNAENASATSADSNRDETLARLAKGIAEDTVRNEFDFHRQVHRWFIAGEMTDVESLDRRVYDELFLMPLDDKWLGLVSGSTYTALENDGLIRDAKED